VNGLIVDVVDDDDDDDDYRSDEQGLVAPAL
jgi:hypothetical protein